MYQNKKIDQTLEVAKKLLVNSFNYQSFLYLRVIDNPQGLMKTQNKLPTFHSRSFLMSV